MNLRPYQIEAYKAALSAIERKEHTVLQLATGTGKSLILSAIANSDEKLRVWILTHVTELVKQNADTYFTFTEKSYGIVCSSLNRADYHERVTFATVQSMKVPAAEGYIAPPDVIIVDEAHRIPNNSDDLGLYETIFKQFPNAIRIGMSATPWRTDNGLIYGTGGQFWFSTRSYEYGVPRAVKEGYLSPLVGVETEQQLDLEDIETTSSEFVLSSVAEKETGQWLNSVARSVKVLANTRNHIAVYCPTVKAAYRAQLEFEKVTGWACEVLTGETKREDRLNMFSRFKTGTLRMLISVDTITTGFDAPHLNCIVALRPTQASNLWVQIQGRGTRLFPGKKNCLILDYVGNFQRLGGVGMVETYVREKGLEAVEEVLAVPTPQKPRAERKVLPGVRSLKPIDPMTGEEAKDGSTLTVQVHSVNVVAIPTRRNPNMPVVLVQYACTTPENARIDASMFINTEEPKENDYTFFTSRKLALYLPLPAAKTIWQVKGSIQPSHVIIRKSGKYWNVVKELFEQQLEKNL